MPRLKQRYEKNPNHLKKGQRSEVVPEDFVGKPVKQVIQRGFTNNRGQAGQKLTVACKLPHGLRLRVDRMIETQVATPQGYKQVKVSEFVTEILLHGSAHPFGVIPKHKIVGGYGLTENVDKELWDQWFKSNENSQYVKERLVFAYPSPEYVADAAEEHEEIRTNLEPLIPPPENPGDPVDIRLPRPSRRGNVGALTAMERGK